MSTLCGQILKQIFLFMYDGKMCHDVSYQSQLYQCPWSRPKKLSLELKILKFQGFFQKKCLKLHFFMLQETVSTENMSTEQIFLSSLGRSVVFSRLFIKYISWFKVHNYCSHYPLSLGTHHFSVSNVASKTWISTTDVEIVSEPGNLVPSRI